MNMLTSMDQISYNADILKELQKPSKVYCSVSDEGDPILQWKKRYQSYVSDSNILTSSIIYSNQETNYEIVSEIQKRDIISGILNLFEILKTQGNNYVYFSNRLYDIIEDDDNVSLDNKSFIGLYNFLQLDEFKLFDLSLQVDEKGRACLQKTYENSFIFIEFLENDKIFYNIMVRNKDITNLGSYNDFFKDFETNYIKG